MACLLSILITSSTLVLFAGRANGRPESFLGTDPGVDPQPDEFRQDLIEALKTKILRGLNLPKPPSGDMFSPKLSSDAIELLQEDQEVIRHEPKENLITHAINADFNCSKSNETKVCLNFEFNITSDMESVASVHVWFHKVPSSKRINVSVYSSLTSPEEEPVITLKEDPSRMPATSGWVTFELPKTLALEPEGDHLLCTVQTEGADIDLDEDHSPFLVVTKHVEVLERKRRVVDTTSSEECTCCTENHYVTLKDLNWQNWVFSPQGFNVKVCKGRCDDSLSAYTLNYQRIISTLYKNNKILPKPKCNFWAPHCKPDKYLPLRMMYVSENNTYHDHVLQDMLIESCKCL